LIQNVLTLQPRLQLGVFAGRVGSYLTKPKSINLSLLWVKCTSCIVSTKTEPNQHGHQWAGF